MVDLTQLMGLFIYIIILAFLTLCMKLYLQINLNPLNFFLNTPEPPVYVITSFTSHLLGFM